MTQTQEPQPTGNDTLAPRLSVATNPEPQYGSVRIIVAANGVKTCRVRRLADGLTAVVRGAEALNVQTGGATVSDTEFPFGSDVTYWAESLDPTGVVSAPTIYRDMGSDCLMVISDPTLPLLSAWFQVAERATLSSVAREDMAVIIGARVPTAVTDVRSGYADATTVVARTRDDILALRALFRTGRPLVLRYPGDWNEPMVYVSIGQVTETRVAGPKRGVNVGPTPERLVAFDWTEVSSPKGPIVQRIGLTYRQLRDAAPATEPKPVTYRQVRLHNTSYLDLLVTGVDW